MPRLPSSQDITRQIPTASRQIAGYRTGQVEEAKVQLSRARGQFGKTISAVGDFVEDEQNRMDDMRAEDALNKAKMKALELAEGDNGFSTVKGEGVIKKPLRKDYTKRFADSMKEIESGLSQSQINKFRRRAQPLSLNYQKSLMSHIGKETTAYQDTTDTATIDIETQSAAANWADPQALADAKARILYTLNGAADRKGLSGKVKTQAINDQLTKMHKGVIAAMAEVDPEGAEAYYKKNKKEINGLERAGIESHIQEKSVKGFSQRESDRIMELGLTDTQSLKEARKIKDADKRSATVSLIKQRIVEDDLAHKEALDEAGRIVVETRDIDQVPNAILGQLKPSEIVSLKSNAKKLREGEIPIHDPKVWNDFNELVTQAGTGNKDAEKKLRDMNIYDELYQSLDQSHFDQAIAARRAFITNDAKAKSKAVSGAGKVITDKAQADLFLNNLFGVKKNTGKGGRKEKHVKFANQFYQIMQSEFEEWAVLNPGKKMSGTERNQILRDLTQTLTVEGGGWFGDKEYELDDIPPDELAEIESDLRQSGIPITGRNLISAYLAAKGKL